MAAPRGAEPSLFQPTDKRKPPRRVEIGATAQADTLPRRECRRIASINRLGGLLRRGFAGPAIRTAESFVAVVRECQIASQTGFPDRGKRRSAPPDVVLDSPGVEGKSLEISCIVHGLFIADLLPRRNGVRVARPGYTSRCQTSRRATARRGHSIASDGITGISSVWRLARL